VQNHFLCLVYTTHSGVLRTAIELGLTYCMLKSIACRSGWTLRKLQVQKHSVVLRVVKAYSYSFKLLQF